MKRVTFGVTYPPERAHPVHRRIEREERVSRAELLMWGPAGTVTALLWFDADPAVVGGILGDVDSLTAVGLVAGDDGTNAFTHQTEYELPDAVMDLVARSKVVFLPPVVFLDDGDARFEAVGETQFLSEFHARLADLLDARIERVRDFRRGSTPASITER
ncbi:bacterio-opsin activator, partial [Halobium palmae]